MDELKPCRKCGGEPSINASGDGGLAVVCRDCGHRTDYCVSLDDAIEDWNRRADDGHKNAD